MTQPAGLRKQAVGKEGVLSCYHPPQVPGTLNVREVPACPWLWMENLCPSRRPPTPWSRSPPSSGLYSCSYSHHLRHRQCVPLSWVTSVRAEAHSAIHGLPEDLTPQSPPGALLPRFLIDSPSQGCCPRCHSCPQPSQPGVPLRHPTFLSGHDDLVSQSKVPPLP